MDARLANNRKRLRQAILAQLSKRRMTLFELADEVEHIAPLNQVKSEIRRLVGSDIVCSTYSEEDNRDLFETWERAVERVKASSGPQRHIVRSRIRRGERVG